MTYSRQEFYNKRLTLRQAAREFCVDCMGGVRKGYESPRYCTDPGCPLFPWRNSQGCDRSYNIAKPPEAVSTTPQSDENE